MLEMFALTPTEIFVGVVIGIAILVFVGTGTMLVKCYRKVEQGTAVVRNGVGGSKVSFSGIFVIPILHQAERMEISVKRIEIARMEDDGLICRDNMRADTKVAFFVRVNKTPQDVLKVAQTVGCRRASDEERLRELFDAKFSEALKTVGKKFDFVELYEERERFKDGILAVIGTDLNGYVLDDCAIDYLEQTPLAHLDPNNILDAEGIKKITDLTAKQQVLANQINRNREKTITKQDVEAREAILELERQRVEAEERQLRDIEATRARERATTDQVREEERLKAEGARIATQEQLDIAEQNKLREVLVAEKAKERTLKIEDERIEKDRLLEVTERERIVELARIEKDKAVEVELRNIQDVIRERVAVEREVVEERERIKDTEEFAGAERRKQVAVRAAEELAEQAFVKETRAAEAAKQAAQRDAERAVIEAQAELDAAHKVADAKKVLAAGVAAEEAASGRAEADVLEAMAQATEKQGTAEANVLLLKAQAEAKGIDEKAAAMAKFDSASRDHEEFRLELDKLRTVELASIDAQKEIADVRSRIVGQALETANIDIVGGDAQFFDKIVGAAASGKSVDTWVGNSRVLRDVKDTFFGGNGEAFKEQLRGFIDKFGMSSEDVKNLSLAALIAKLMAKAGDDDRRQLGQLLGMAKSAGLSGSSIGDVANRFVGN